jgi:gliding motility-associated-like protein
MNKLFQVSLLVVQAVSMFGSILSKAQNANLANGIYNDSCVEKSKDHNFIFSQKTSSTFSCGEDNFWSYDVLQSDEIREYSILGNVISFTGNFLPQAPGISIAICDNLNGGSLSPTLYCSSFSSFYYWDGVNSWVKNLDAPIPNLYNAGGSGQYLVNLVNLPDSIQLIRFDGSSYTNIFSLKKNSGCADIALDESGNIHLITSDNAFSPTTDSLFIISPFGQVLKKYPLVFKKNNAYGCFLRANILYVGLGNQHPDFPNTLLPIEISAYNLTIGIPLALPSGVKLTNDLAACLYKPSSDSSITSSLIYPTIFTPNADGINDSFEAIKRNIYQLSCKVYSRWGLQVAELNEVNSSWDGRTTSGITLPDGVYFYEALGFGLDEKEHKLKGFVHLVR